MKNEVILFKNQNIRLEVNMQDETILLNILGIYSYLQYDIDRITKQKSVN